MVLDLLESVCWTKYVGWLKFRMSLASLLFFSLCPKVCCLSVGVVETPVKLATFLRVDRWIDMNLLERRPLYLLCVSLLRQVWILRLLLLQLILRISSSLGCACLRRLHLLPASFSEIHLSVSLAMSVSLWRLYHLGIRFYCVLVSSLTISLYVCEDLFSRGMTGSFKKKETDFLLCNPLVFIHLQQDTQVCLSRVLEVSLFAHPEFFSSFCSLLRSASRVAPTSSLSLSSLSLCIPASLGAYMNRCFLSFCSLDAFQLTTTTGGLEADVTGEELESVFSKYGQVSTVWVARNPPGFAFLVR